MEKFEKLGPLDATDHKHLFDIEEVCVSCGKRLQVGEFITLVPVGPSDDPEARALCREGRAYNAVAKIAHYACITGIED